MASLLLSYGRHLIQIVGVVDESTGKAILIDLVNGKGRDALSGIQEVRNRIFAARIQKRDLLLGNNVDFNIDAGSDSKVFKRLITNYPAKQALLYFLI